MLKNFIPHFNPDFMFTNQMCPCIEEWLLVSHHTFGCGLMVCVPVQVGRVWTVPSRALAVRGDWAATRHASAPMRQRATRSMEPARARRAGGRSCATCCVPWVQCDADTCVLREHRQCLFPRLSWCSCFRKDRLVWTAGRDVTVWTRTAVIRWLVCAAVSQAGQVRRPVYFPA